MTTPQAEAALDVLTSICETIKDAGSVPEGTLYAALMAAGCSLENYERILGVLQRTGLVKVHNHVVTWVGEGH